MSFAEFEHGWMWERSVMNKKMEVDAIFLEEPCEYLLNIR